MTSASRTHSRIGGFFDEVAHKYLSLTKLQRLGVVSVCGTLIVALILPFIFFDGPNEARAALTTIRQEINIIDGPVSSVSGSYATSSETVQVDPSQYNGATMYFEVVASTTSATNATIALVNASTGAITASVTINGTSHARYRSTSFSPGATTEYRIRAGNESVGKGALAARIVILQNSNPITNTETQIEIGSNESYTSTATSTFASPKYWLYDSTKWDGSPTFYAEVTYGNTIEPASVVNIATTTYTASQSVVLSANNTSTKIMLWGAGGAGGPAVANPSGGAGGAGGQFAQSTLSGLAGLTKTLTIAGAIAGCTSGVCSQGATTTWDTTVVVAGGGNGGGQTTASTTGNTSGCVGSDFCVAGGGGGAGTTAYGAGGGGGPGVNATGNSSTAAGVAGTASTDTNGGAGGAKNTTSKTNGNAGGNYGAGGGGAFRAGNGATLTGGAGAQGKAIIVETSSTPITATTTISIQEDNGSFGGWTDKAFIVVSGNATSPTRVRSSAFTPTTGRNYRIAFSNGYTGATFAVYNAKIIVDQTNPNLLEAQYLLANAKLASGTGLQKFLTSWDATEWAGSTNVYKHEVDSASGSSSVVEVDTSGGTQVTGSVVTSPSSRSQSASVTMPATGDLDMKATTNNNDVYASRILVQVSPDTTAPTPDPMTFATAPTADSTTQISMTASTATDTASPPVQYLFGFVACGADGGSGGSDSSWQSGTTFSDSGLQPNQCYGYKVQARDSAGTPNATASSSLATIYTLANTPGTPTLGSPTSYTLTLTNTENGNPVSTPNTSFAVLITVTSGSDPTWDGKYVDVSGGFGVPVGSAVWLADSQLDGLVLGGGATPLQASVTYQATVKARNQNSIETAFSTGGSGTTSAPPPPSNSPNEVIIKGGTRLRGGVRLR